MSKKGAGGRPRIVESPEEFDARVDAYVAGCKDAKEPVTFTGLALALGFADRQSLYDYGKRPEFSGSAKRARSLVEAEYEKRLSGNSPTGAIFALKNHGWADRLEHTGADGGPMELANLSDAELVQRAQQHINRLTGGQPQANGKAHTNGKNGNGRRP